MDEPINKMQCPEHVNDRACDLLRLKFGYKNYTEIRERMKNLCSLEVSDEVFSLSKTLLYSKGRYEEKKTSGNIGSDTKEKIADALIRILREDYKIEFTEEGYFVNTEVPQERWGRLYATPDTAIFQRIEYENIFEQFKSAQEVKVLHTYITGIEKFKMCCEEALRKNEHCTFQIMLMEPHSVALHLRERGLSEKVEDIMKVCTLNVDALSSLQSKYPNQVFFRLYDEIPGIIFYKVGNQIYVGHTWYQQLGYEGSYYVAKFNRDNIFHADINENFNRLWNTYALNNGFSATHTFYIHLLRNREQVSIQLDFDKNSLKARLSQTPYGLDFYGFLFEQSTRQISFWFVTKYDSVFKGERRCASLFTSLMPSTWDKKGLFCGQYTVTTNDNSLRANTVLITNEKELTEDQRKMVSKFLSINSSLNDTTELKINPTEITNWGDLEDFLKKRKNNS